MKTENLAYKNMVHTLWLRSIIEDKYINMSAWFIHYILAQISKPPPIVCGNISGILKGAFMKFCINNNESMSCVSVKNKYLNIAI